MNTKGGVYFSPLFRKNPPAPGNAAGFTQRMDSAKTHHIAPERDQNAAYILYKKEKAHNFGKMLKKGAGFSWEMGRKFVKNKQFFLQKMYKKDENSAYNVLYKKSP